LISSSYFLFSVYIFTHLPLNQVTFTFVLSFGNDNILSTKEQNREEESALGKNLSTDRKFLKMLQARIHTVKDMNRLFLKAR